MKRGFTLVELLVVIAIIAMLAGLLLPAVNNAREAGRQTQCMNNIRNFAQAATSYAATKGSFPGYRARLSLRRTPEVNNPMVTWQQLLWPQLGKNDFYSAWKDPNNFPNSAEPVPTDPKTIATYWELSVCPSDVTIAGKTDPQTSYVVNTGLKDVPEGANVQNAPDNKANGVFHDHAAKNKVKMTLDYLAQADGTSTTFLMSENLDVRNYCNVYPSPDSDTIEVRTGFIFFAGTVTGKALPNVDGGAALTDTVNEIGRARPSSSHNGGFNAAFCDASVKLVKTEIDYNVYCLLITPNGKKTVEPGTTTPSPLLIPVDQRTPVSDGTF